jgi:hypothetical protein
MQRAMWVLVMALAFVPAVAQATPVQGNACYDWDRAQFGDEGANPPTLDRLTSGDSDALLSAWLADNCMRLNHVQVLGSHNSYHLQPLAPVLELIGAVDPDAALSVEYDNRPLAEQFSTLGIRQIELDVFADPGPTPLFAAPIGEAAFGTVPIPGMLEPGPKVLHTQDIDYRSTCLTFAACLQEIENWSLANPNHLPIMVLVEAKDGVLELPSEVPGVGPIPPAAVPVPYGPAELQALDDTIRSVFSADQLMTPDDVRGDRATLEEAVLKDGWPTLNELRGRVFFTLDDTDAKRDMYIAGHPSLAGRVMFTSSDPGTPEAAFVKLNDPLTDFATIQSLVAQGYIVRTRADANTVNARLGSTEQRDAALASGAQFVSTDYAEPNPDFGTGYMVAIPGGEIGRCNPILSPPTCDAATFEVVAGTATPPGPSGSGNAGLQPGSDDWGTWQLLLALAATLGLLGAARLLPARRRW